METPALSRTDYWVLTLLTLVFLFAGTSFLGIFFGRIVFIDLGVSFPGWETVIYVVILTAMAFISIKYMLLPKIPLAIKVLCGAGVLAAYLFTVTCIGGVILHMVETKGMFKEIIPFYTTGQLLGAWLVDYVVVFILWVGKEIIPKTYKK